MPSPRGQKQRLLIRMRRITPNSRRAIRLHSWNSDVLLLVVAAFGARLGAQSPRQTQADDYTRYELLAPGTAKFRILYEVTATTAGATHFFNAIRRGSVASDERVLRLHELPVMR